MRQRVRAVVNRVRGSLFYVPAGFVVVSVAVAVAATEIPEAMAMANGPQLASSRVILTTIAGATITVAGIVFSITLVALQLSASQFSTRVLQGFLRDRFSQMVIGLVVGTFTYRWWCWLSCGPSPARAWPCRSRCCWPSSRCW